jgi:hypothetical protein
MTKGANFSPTEDLELCKAFVATSEDATVGTDQKGAEFKVKMFEVYCKLINDHNKKYNTSYNFRMGHSNFQRFKKISRFALKWIGVEEAAGEPPSGDTDKIEWLKNCKETFLLQNPDGKSSLENVLFCKDFLQECPKWRPFEESNEALSAALSSKRKERPAGSKKAKQLKKDMELVAQLSGLSKEKVNEREQSVVNHQRAQQDFMNQVGSGMSAFAAVLSEQNDAKLLEMMTPRTRNKMAKQMFQVKMQKMMGVSGASIGGSSKKTPVPKKVFVLETSPEPESDDEKSNSAAGSDDSPGDNRVRSPGGTLRLPDHLRRKYAAQRKANNSDGEDEMTVVSE